MDAHSPQHPWQPLEASKDKIQAVHNALKNFWTGQPSTGPYRLIQQRRQQLPVYKHADEFFKEFAKQGTRAVIFEAGTGTGKTTIGPQLAMEACTAQELRKKQQRVYVTEPRRVAVLESARRVAKEMGVRLGQEVGYRIGGQSQYSRKTIINYVTDSWMVTMVKHGVSQKERKPFDDCGVLFIDEAHTDSIAMDELKVFARKFITADNPWRKIVLASATQDAKQTEDFFGGASRLEVPGKGYPVEVRYLRQMPGKWEEEMVEQVFSLHEQADGLPGDMLLFVPGKADVYKIIRSIRDRAEKEDAPLQPIPLHGGMTDDERAKAFGPPPAPYGARPGRKIIVATNIAEASLTFDGVEFIIDSVREKVQAFDPATKVVIWKTGLISKAQAKQRRGRAGRTAPGLCIRLITEAVFESWSRERPLPETLTADVTNATHDIMFMGTNSAMDFNPTTFEWPNPPSTEAHLRAMQTLHDLTILEPTFAPKLTQWGEQVGKYDSVPRHLAFALHESHKLDCSWEILAIVAMAQANEDGSLWPVQYTPKMQSQQAAAKDRWCHHLGYYPTLLVIYLGWTQACNKGEQAAAAFVKDNVMSRGVLEAADKSRTQLMEGGMFNNRIPLLRLPLTLSDENYWALIMQALCRGCFIQSAFKDPGSNDRYTTLKEGTNAQVEMSAFPGHRGKELDWVIYDKLVNFEGPGRNRMVGCTLVTVDQLITARPVYHKPEFLPKGPARDAITEAMARLTGRNAAELVTGETLPQRKS